MNNINELVQQKVQGVSSDDMDAFNGIASDVMNYYNPIMAEKKQAAIDAFNNFKAAFSALENVEVEYNRTFNIIQYARTKTTERYEPRNKIREVVAIIASGLGC